MADPLSPNRERRYEGMATFMPPRAPAALSLSPSSTFTRFRVDSDSAPGSCARDPLGLADSCSCHDHAHQLLRASHHNARQHTPHRRARLARACTGRRGQPAGCRC